MIEPFKVSLERETRFELATSTLARLHSTTELFPLVCLCQNRAKIQIFVITVNEKSVLIFDFFLFCQESAKK